MEAMTIEFSLWLLGIAVAMIGIGLALSFQGAVWVKPKRQERVGKLSLAFGIVWMVLGILYLISAAIFSALS